MMKSFIQIVLMILGIFLLIPVVLGVGFYLFCRLIIFFLPLICFLAICFMIYGVVRLIMKVRK